MKRKIICMLIVISMLSTIMIQTVYATSKTTAIDNIQLESLNSIGVTLDTAEKITPLYNADDTVIAYCIEGEASFSIIDLNGMVVVHNSESNSPFFNLNKRIYINGPMGFYTKEGNAFIHVVNEKERLTANDFNNNKIVTVQTNLKTAFSKESENTASTRAITSDYITKSLRNYEYNPSGICMGTAGAILLAYYKDNVNSNIAAARHINADGVGLTILLAEGSYYRYSGSAASTAAQVLNWYMGLHGSTSYTASYTTSNIFSTVKSKISANRPLQAHFDDGDINHSVVIRGYRQDSSNSNNNYVYCNYGWGSAYSNMQVNANHVYGVIWINA